MPSDLTRPELRARSDPRLNQLLAALPAAEWERWLPQLEFVQLTPGQILYEPGRPITHVYFPTTSIVSMLYPMQNGNAAEIAVVGCEGIVGIPLFMGGKSTSSRAVAQDGGQAYRLPAVTLEREFRAAPVLHLLLRYVQALMAQMMQTAACNKHHTLEQQLCRWLLLGLDRLPNNEVVMTQQLVANMLGASLDRILVAEEKLRAGNLITFTGGHITVVNRPGLEMASCECYHVVKNEYDRLLPDACAA